MNLMQHCPCGSGKSYGACCGLFVEDGERPTTAEQLMRSRYTAYMLGREAYLLRTWHPSTRPQRLDLAAGPAPKWLGLRIVRTAAGGAGDEEGMVEFIARFRLGGNKAERLHEVSRFIKVDGQWLYLDGEMSPLG